jgi:GPH family glycoside/pentoside/hexuronide:cation symporter
MIYVTLAFMFSDTLSTLVSVPYLSLTPELAPEYDERTLLTSYRTVFQLASALTVVIAAPMIIDAVVLNGATRQQGFLLVGAIFGALGAMPLFLIGLFIKETSTPLQQPSLPFRETFRVALQNIPFRYAVGMYMLNWSAVDMVAITFPYFLLYWIARGDMLAKINLFGIDLALESAFFGVLMSVCILFVPFWLWLARKRNKREAYMFGMAFWALMQFLIFTIPQGNTAYLIFIAALAGVGVSAAYVLPDSIFPDVIEWDELRTRRRQEGVYYGIRTLIRKSTGALAIFLTLQLLGWSGYQSPPENVTLFAQPASALTMIRWLVSPIGGTILIGTIIVAYFYPLSREKHARIKKLLERRKNGVESREWRVESR